MSVHAFTSFSFSYLNRARVLASSLRRQHPDWTIWAIVTDRAPPGFELDLARENFDIALTVEDLFGGETERWLFGHDVVEACTAVKGRAAAHILGREDCDKLFYFDPDIAIFNRLDPLVEMLDDRAVILTPHQVTPDPRANPRAIRDNEVTSLDYGVFNLGFAGIHDEPEGRRFVAWWEDRLADWCHDRLDIGVFVDQKWCNLVPCFFDRVGIVRDPGYNVASWNLSQRRLVFDDDGRALINGQPLRFFHFTKLGNVGDLMTQRYAGDNREVYELWWWYRQEVESHQSPDIPRGWWYYGTFDDGTPIPKPVRELYRDRRDLKEAFPMPRKAGPGSFAEWLLGNTDLLEPGATSGGFLPA